MNEANAKHIPESIRVGVSIDSHYKWPCFRVRDMIDPADSEEIESYRQLFESAPDVLRQRNKLLAACKMQVEIIEIIHGNLGLAGLIDAAKGTGLSHLGYAEAMKQFKSFIADTEKTP